ncbi:MAG TPA: hypothetical protein VI997_08885 [Candidatus Thermoplasmatota archaeon]|nr:hypothetical protein [Candidatus Thermoplasmatota archaeon]
MRTALDRNEPEDEEIKAVKTGLEDAEKKHRRLIDKRNECNDRARELRDERDGINAQKRALVEEMRRIQTVRDENNAIARSHRDRRNEYQRQAKALIEAKRKLGPSAPGAGPRAYAGKVRELEAEVKIMEHRQQTEPMPVAKENELLDKMREKMKELEVARVQHADETRLLADVKDVNVKIDELFRIADEEHQKAVEAGNAAQASHDAIRPILDQLRFLDEESDKKHQGHIEAREQANKAHEEASNLREEVITLRDKRSAIFRERKSIVTEQRDQVRAALNDPSKLEEAADDAVTALLTKGKITLGPR